MGRRKSALEDVLETSFRYPIFGVIIAAVSGGAGYYFSHKKGEVGTPSGLFNGVYDLVGTLLYVFSTILLILSVIGFIIGYVRKKHVTDSLQKDEGSGNAPKCPICGARMVVRVSKKGKFENEPFWGCTNYPRCRGIVKYSSFPK